MKGVRSRVLRHTGGQNSYKKLQKTAKGTFDPRGFVVILFLFLVGGGYLYSVNQNAVQGFHMRKLEKEIGVLKDDNAQLQIEEADKRSLARIEGEVVEKSMQKVNEATVINDGRSIASR